jgi:hypothetical protein
VDHFSDLFSSSQPVLDSDLSDLVECVITDEENSGLCLIPDEGEIFAAIIDLGLDKAPGPDGMTGLIL